MDQRSPPPGLPAPPKSDSHPTVVSFSLQRYFLPIPGYMCVYTRELVYLLPTILLCVCVVEDT